MKLSTQLVPKFEIPDSPVKIFQTMDGSAIKVTIGGVMFIEITDIKEFHGVVKSWEPGLTTPAP